MSLSIENRGSGFIGILGDGWRVSLNDSPSVVGTTGGRLGSISFSARCNNTSKFTIDNYLSVKHFFDDQTSRWLSTFDGYVRSVSTDGDFGTFGMNSILSALDVERVASTDAAGTYERTFELPVGVEYTISGTAYWTGGYYTSVGSENVFVRQDILIYDIAAYGDFVYVLASGGHAGEVVFRMYADGRFQSVWPVYSDATDIASPNSTTIAAWSGGIAVGQQQAKRVKIFSASGVFSTQFGALGSLDGQFQTVSGLAVSDSFDSIFVSDSVLGRIQRFNKAGVYQNKWGTLGTGSGTSVFNAPNQLAIDPITEHIFVADMSARVRTYDSFGNYQAQPMGSYSTTVNDTTGEYVTGQPIGVGFDQRGNAYGMQQGRFFKYGRTFISGVSSSWFYGSAMMKKWQAEAYGTATYIAAFAGDYESGHIYAAHDRNLVEKYSGSLGSLPAYILHYIGLAAADFPVQFLTINAPNGSGPYPYKGWQGNVWQSISDLCAATGNAAMVFDDRLLFFNRADRTFHLPTDSQITPVALNSRASGRTVRAVNQRASWTDKVQQVYSAVADDRRVFTTDVNGFAYVTVEQGSHLDYVVQPVAVSALGPLAPGQYTIVDQDMTPVSSTAWRNYGGQVRAEVGTEPGTIVLTIIGPSLELPGTNAPYKLTDVGGTPTLTILGSGIITNPEVLNVGTGVSEAVTSTEVAQSIDSPFLYDAATAYTEASWAAYNSGTPNQEVTIRFRVGNGFTWDDDSTGVGGTFQFINTYVLHDDSEYLVQHVDYDRAWITLTCTRANRGGHDATHVGDGNVRFEEIWRDSTTAAFEAYWNTFTAQDFAIAPLRNPFGYNYSTAQ